MRSVSVLLLCAATAARGASTCPAAGDGWTTTTLDSTIAFVSQHKIVGTKLHLRLQAKTTGWLGFGFGEESTGHMKGADMMTAYVVGDTVVVDDRYATFAASAGATSSTGDQGLLAAGLTAKKDTHNDWTIESGSETDGVTSVYATRELDTGDQQDRVIGTTDPTRIVWAYGGGDGVSYHGTTRGATAIHFGGELPTIPANDGSWTRRISNYNIRAGEHTSGTTYACEGFTLPSDKTRHAVAFRPVFSADTKKHVHHMILHTCSNNAYFQAHKDTPQACRTSSDGGASSSAVDVSTVGSGPLGAGYGCDGMLWAWASGQGDFVLPADAGFVLDSTSANIILEVHYDNPSKLTDIVDDVGVEIFYTETLRTHEAGWFWTGDPHVRVGSPQSSPPTNFKQGALAAGETDVHRQGTCPGACTSSFDGSSPMHVFALFHHMHYTGKRIYLEQRDSAGNLLSADNTKLKVDFWDNGFQTMVPFSANEFTVNRGDSLTTHCFFDTTRYDTAIAFGQGTAEEMCMHAFAYYPLAKKSGTPVSQCGLRPEGDTWASFCGGETLASAVQPVWAAPAATTFGTTDKLAVGTANAAQCSPPTFGTTVSFTATASGDMSTYNTAEVKDAIALSVATALDVAPSQVSVTVSAGSVVIAVSIATTSSAAGALSTALTSTHLASTSAATTLLSASLPSGVSLTVASVTQPTTSSAAPSPPPPSPSSSDEFPIVAIVAPIAGVAGLVLLGALLVYFRRKSPAPRAEPKSVASQEA